MSSKIVVCCLSVEDLCSKILLILSLVSTLVESAGV